MGDIVFSPDLTVPDALVLRNLADDIERHKALKRRADPGDRDEGYASTGSSTAAKDATQEDYGISTERDAEDLRKMNGLNDPESEDFEPTVISMLDVPDIKARLPTVVYDYVVVPYIALAQKVVRHETDVVMLTHLLLYLGTSLPSALFLFYRFSYLHAIIHVAMQGWYMGPYTLMMHQHIHMRGILSRDGPWLLRLVDAGFPYVTDPLMGHTWNTYFYHHVKHHHVEGNGPDDLSSTLRYQRDDWRHFLHYVGRFLVLIWIDLPRYYLRKGQPGNAVRAGGWELSNYVAIYACWCLNPRAATFTLLVPLFFMRIALMVGNWGQHAFVDRDEPDSDFRSSITLIDVPSNRLCYNDGYHTSHHLNPMRHWRHHPAAFLRQKATYAAEKALVFHDIDYFMMTMRLLRRDYAYLAARLVPVGAQMDLSMAQREELLRAHTKRFTEEELKVKFGGKEGEGEKSK
ncbi:fatty acid desaturase [Chaetomium sp. MPI-SDFR-AT-0129]|nr:fatty acid desaturase [Chaetomium sp. MPI-SDFR-AT-0129]